MTLLTLDYRDHRVHHWQRVIENLHFLRTRRNNRRTLKRYINLPSISGALVPIYPYFLEYVIQV